MVLAAPHKPETENCSAATDSADERAYLITSAAALLWIDRSTAALQRRNRPARRSTFLKQILFLPIIRFAGTRLPPRTGRYSKRWRAASGCCARQRRRSRRRTVRNVAIRGNGLDRGLTSYRKSAAVRWLGGLGVSGSLAGPVEGCRFRAADHSAPHSGTGAFVPRRHSLPGSKSAAFDSPRTLDVPTSWKPLRTNSSFHSSSPSNCSGTSVCSFQ